MVILPILRSVCSLPFFLSSVSVTLHSKFWCCRICIPYDGYGRAKLQVLYPLLLVPFPLSIPPFGELLNSHIFCVLSITLPTSVLEKRLAKKERKKQSSPANPSGDELAGYETPPPREGVSSVPRECRGWGSNRGLFREGEHDLSEGVGANLPIPLGRLATGRGCCTLVRDYVSI